VEAVVTVDEPSGVVAGIMGSVMVPRTQQHTVGDVGPPAWIQGLVA
jgi:hypothetical protein